MAASTEDLLTQADGPTLVDLARTSHATAPSRDVLVAAARATATDTFRAARFALAAALLAGDYGPPSRAARSLERRLLVACGELGVALFEIDAIADAAEREAPLAGVLSRLATSDAPEATRQLTKLTSAAHRDRALAAIVEATHGVFLAQKISDEALRAGALASIGEWEEAELVVADIASESSRSLAHQRIAAAARLSGDEARAAKHEALATTARAAVESARGRAAVMREAATIAGGALGAALLAEAEALDPSPDAARDARERRARLAVADGRLDEAIDAESIVALFPDIVRARLVGRDAPVGDVALVAASDAIAWAEARAEAVLEAAASAPAPRPSGEALDSGWETEEAPATTRAEIDRGKPPWAPPAEPLVPAPIVSVAPPDPSEPAAASYDDSDATSIMGTEVRQALQRAARTSDDPVMRELAERIASDRDTEERRLAMLTEGYDTARKIPIATGDRGSQTPTPSAFAPQPEQRLPSVIAPPLDLPPEPALPPSAALVAPTRSPLRVVGLVALLAIVAVVVAFYARMLRN